MLGSLLLVSAAAFKPQGLSGVVVRSYFVNHCADLCGYVVWLCSDLNKLKINKLLKKNECLFSGQSYNFPLYALICYRNGVTHSELLNQSPDLFNNLSNTSTTCILTLDFNARITVLRAQLH